MILLDTGLNVLDLNKYMKEIETETFVPVSVSQYRTLIYESLAQDKLPSLEYYRYKLSQDSLDLLYSLPKPTGQTLYFENECSLDELDLPNLEFIYAQRNVEDISTIVSDVEISVENNKIIEENCFTNSENDVNVKQEEEFVATNEDAFDSFFNMQQDLPTKNPYFTSYSDVLNQQDTPETRTTDTWNKMASNYGKITKPTQVEHSELSQHHNSGSNIPTESELLQQRLVEAVQSNQTNPVSNKVLQQVNNPPTNNSAAIPHPVNNVEIPTDIRKFLKLYPNSEIDFVLQYFSKKDIERALKLGKILRKGTKLHI